MWLWNSFWLTKANSVGCSLREAGGGWAIPPNYCYGSNYGLAWHVHRQEALGMQSVINLEQSTHVHVLAMPITHTCADRLVDALMPNFCCFSNLTQMPFTITSILIGGQRRRQVIPQRTTGSTANKCLSFSQQPVQRLYLIKILPTYLSHLTAFVTSLTSHIRATNLPDPALFRLR